MEQEQNTQEEAGARPETRSLPLRVLLMIVMACAYQICGMLLLVSAVAQIVFVAVLGRPNPHLLAFGASLGRYYRQNVEFLTFVSEQAPFPFSPWP